MKQLIKTCLFALILISTSCGSETKTIDPASADSSAADSVQNLSATETLTPQGNPLENAEGKITNRGIIVAGEGQQMRAFTAFRSGEGISSPYIKLANDFRREFPDANIYAIVIPGAGAYYVPKMLEEKTKPVKPAFDYIREHLDSTIKYVDVYNTLAAHTKEDIFLRTDHHWAPLGAYYTARALASAAGLPFKDLSNYDEHIVHGYVGSMVHYSGEKALKEYPEDFHYYTPKGTNEKTTFISYNVDKEQGKVSEKGSYTGEFFHHYPDGAGGAYCTFMGGDHFTVKVETGVPNSRRLLLVKDSHGNPIPAYLFYSFEEIHVVDYRYFTRNLKKYVADNKITDIALAFGINTSSASGNMQKVRDFLTQ